MVPRIIGTLLRLVCAGFAVSAELVEVDAVCAGVGENAVQNDGDPALFRILAEGAEVLVGAQQGVYPAVVRCVVAVVLVGLEDGVQIDAGDAQILQVVQLAPDALQIAAEIVVVPDVAVFIGPVVGRFAPLPHDTVCGDILVGFAAAAEAVGEDLVHDAALEKFRGLVVLGKDGELEHPAVVQRAVTGIATLDVGAHAAAGIGEIVVVHALVLGAERGGIDGAARLVAPGAHGEEALLEAGAEYHQNRGIVQRGFLRQANGKAALLVPADCAERRLIGFVPAVIEICHGKRLLSGCGKTGQNRPTCRPVPFCFNRWMQWDYRMFQISFAYSLTARSAEKMPAFAMLCRDILVHVSVSVYSCELCSCT